MEDCKKMKQYNSGNLDDCCFFNHCNFCGANFVIEEEFAIHLNRCKAASKEFQKLTKEAQEIFEKLPNIEQEC